MPEKNPQISRTVLVNKTIHTVSCTLSNRANNSRAEWVNACLVQFNGTQRVVSCVSQDFITKRNLAEKVV